MICVYKVVLLHILYELGRYTWSSILMSLHLLDQEVR